MNKPELEDAAAEINRLHGEICGAVKITVEKAIRVGQLLTECKKECGHGNWLKWLEINVEFTDRTARNYIVTYENRVQLKSENVSDLSYAYNFAKGKNMDAQAANEKEALNIGQDPKVTAANKNRDRKAIIGYLKKVELDGSTCEKAETDLEMSHQTCSARFADLKRDGVIVPKMDSNGTVVKRKTKTGSKASVFVLAPENTAPPPAPMPNVHETAEQAKKATEEIKEVSKTKPKIELLKGALPQPLYEKGFTTIKDANGNNCTLVPDVSELEYRECVAVEIGGTKKKEGRRKYFKWRAYRSRKIRERVLKVLASMSVIEVPDKPECPGFTFSYDLKNGEDLEELVTMLHADLMRIVQANKQIAKHAAKAANNGNGST